MILLQSTILVDLSYLASFIDSSIKAHLYACALKKKKKEKEEEEEEGNGVIGCERGSIGKVCEWNECLVRADR